MLDLFEDGLASLRRDFQEGVGGVDGWLLPTSPGGIVEGTAEFSPSGVWWKTGQGLGVQFRVSLSDA